MVKIEKKVGKRIRFLRKKYDWTQEELADKVGVDYTTINKIENGKRNPSLKTLERIAKALRVKTKELL